MSTFSFFRIVHAMFSIRQSRTANRTRGSDNNSQPLYFINADHLKKMPALEQVEKAIVLATAYVPLLLSAVLWGFLH